MLLKASWLEVHPAPSKEVSKMHIMAEAEGNVDVCQDLSDILANYRRPPSTSTSRSPVPLPRIYPLLRRRLHLPSPYYPAGTNASSLPSRRIVRNISTCLRVIHPNRPCGAFRSSTKPTHSVLGPVLSSAFPAHPLRPAKLADSDESGRARPTIARRQYSRAMCPF